MSERQRPAGDHVLVEQRVLASIDWPPTPHGDYSVHVGLTSLRPGGCTDVLQHDVPEVVTMLSGSLEVCMDGDWTTIRAGDTFVITASAWHAFSNVTDRDASMLFAFGGDPTPVTRRRVVETGR
ncbi:cupin domain-containing protein [Nocardioides agariphilus]|uniref:Cupin domain-containing protein n=1 Tax=Nocardioides agariphilus TaxID=433664 RepID=A0A930YJN5_9ACTN|nr:cupin domain-containing protein [Nocardioides agariphilus]MBF4769363.1 cupin domain-containing protein [Nocardioides agariphilus]